MCQHGLLFYLLASLYYLETPIRFDFIPCGSSAFQRIIASCVWCVGKSILFSSFHQHYDNLGKPINTHDFISTNLLLSTILSIRPQSRLFSCLTTKCSLGQASACLARQLKRHASNTNPRRYSLYAGSCLGQSEGRHHRVQRHLRSCLAGLHAGKIMVAHAESSGSRLERLDSHYRICK